MVKSEFDDCFQNGNYDALRPYHVDNAIISCRRYVFPVQASVGYETKGIFKGQGGDHDRAHDPSADRG